MEVVDVFIPSRQRKERIELEGRLHVPDERSREGAALVCHPHPLGGGSMDNYLIVALAEEMCGAGLPALRFNFRGVGESQGVFAGGVEEWEDIAAAIAFLAGREGTPAVAMDLVGWSFGSAVCLTAVAQGLEPRSLTCISPPLAMIPEEIGERVQSSRFPISFVVGDSDQFCPVEQLRSFARTIRTEEKAGVTVLTGANHFLMGREQEVAGIVRNAIGL